MKTKKRVLVGMSGGVDSSMAAILLKDLGYDVIGITMKLGDTKISLGSSLESSTCCSLEDIADARDLALKYEIPHYVADLKEEFEKYVIDPWVESYSSGVTPNPCIACNKYVKWGKLLNLADQLNCDYLATGHYARIMSEDDRYWIGKPADSAKDQTYFLWDLSQDQLKRTLFPLGDYTKDEIRAKAIELGFEGIATKGDSSDICFIGDTADYRDFLRIKNPALAKLEGGPLVDTDGNKIGTHEGFPFYTIGQRRGLGISLGYPAYVIDIDAKSNTLTVGAWDDLNVSSAIVDGINVMKPSSWDKGGEFKVKVRSFDRGTMVDVESNGSSVTVNFRGTVAGGVTPGQSAVFYDAEGDMVAGGFIMK